MRLSLLYHEGNSELLQILNRKSANAEQLLPITLADPEGGTPGLVPVLA